jgi:hypothetical protein
MVQVIEGLSIKHKALGSSSSITEGRKEGRREGGTKEREK